MKTICCIFFLLVIATISFAQLNRDTIVARESRVMKNNLQLDSLQFVKVTKLNKRMLTEMDSVYRLTQTADAKNQSMKQVNRLYRKDIKQVLSATQFASFLASRKNAREKLALKAAQKNIKVKPVLSTQDDNQN